MGGEGEKPGHSQILQRLCFVNFVTEFIPTHLPEMLASGLNQLCGQPCESKERTAPSESDSVLLTCDAPQRFYSGKTLPPLCCTFVAGSQ